MNIQPLGEQIIIKTLPPSVLGSIIIPESAKKVTMMGEKGEQDAVHFVEAEVIACGPGKRQKGDPGLLPLMVKTLRYAAERLDAPIELTGQNDDLVNEIESLVEIADRTSDCRQPMLVKPGDRILYHPAVQKFDRDITDVMVNGDNPPIPGSQYFMIREESVLAVIER